MHSNSTYSAGPQFRLMSGDQLEALHQATL